jgi:protein CpxP
MRMLGERVDARIAYMKTALKITPAQERQWNAVADVIRKQAKAVDDERQARRAQPRPQSVSAIDRLQQRQQSMTASAARLNELVDVARPLYVSLNDEQKKTADEMLAAGGGRFRHHGRWH